MRITFVGSGHGVPSAERHCSCVMLEVNDALYFIDAGAPLIDEILRREKDLNRVRAVFTTHRHGDHISGLFNMAGLIEWYYKTASVAFYLTDEDTKKLVEDYMYVTLYNQPTFERVSLQIAQEGLVYRDENISVHYFLTKHGVNKKKFSPSYGILVEAEGKKVLFSGDLSVHLAENDFPQIALEEQLDTMVLEFAHFTYEDVKPYLEKCRVKQMWINHLFPLSKIDAINEVKEEYDYPIYIAKDGDEIDL